MRNTSGCDIDGYAVAVDGSNVQVLYSRSADLDQNWALEFAEDSEAKRDLLIQDRGSTFDIQAYQGGDRRPVTRNDLAAAGEVLCHAGRVPHGGEIEFHFDGGAGKGNASPGAAQIGGPYRVLQRDSLDTWIASANQLGLDNLVAQLSSSMGVIPFVGAGISAAFGFRNGASSSRMQRRGTRKSKRLSVWLRAASTWMQLRSSTRQVQAPFNGG